MQAIRELGIFDTSIDQWHKELAAHEDETFPGNGHQIEVFYNRQHYHSSLAYLSPVAYEQQGSHI